MSLIHSRIFKISLHLTDGGGVHAERNQDIPFPRDPKLWHQEPLQTQLEEDDNYVQSNDVPVPWPVH